jgi:hypothetical protein
MKKILSQIILVSMAYTVNAQTVIASDLMKEAFPTPGFTKCYSDRGKINWAAVKRIEDSQGSVGVNAVSTYVINNIQPCMTSANPNFTAQIKNSCKANAGAQNQVWLCQAAGTPVEGAQATANTAVLAISSTQASQLLETAVPKSSSPIDSCPASSGRVNWSIAKQLTQNGFTPQVQDRLMKVVLPCILEKNKNMVDELENTCLTPVNLKEQNVICERIATLRKRPNAVTTAAQQAVAAAAQPVATPQPESVVVGVAIPQGASTGTVEGTVATTTDAATQCPNLNAEKADLANQQSALTAQQTALDDYKKQLEDFHGQLTTIREQLVAYQAQLQQASQ